jgi:mono/diheme cytochrome c family protein
MDKTPLAFTSLLLLFAPSACGPAPEAPEAAEVDLLRGALTPAEERGRDVWFKSTFGGERFFSLILSGPPFNLRLGLDALVTSPRDTRFTEYGVLNDPDCAPGDASTGYLDRCADPNSAGIIGVRKFVVTGPGGPRVLLGVSCASCHAGLDPARPPADPNHPAWENIHPTIGNQFLDVGKIFRVHLSSSDPRYQVFHTWAPGTVDTTAIESDHINNPGIITQFFDLPRRPLFDVTDGGRPVRVGRSGQGGEDDVGCEKAALRVYFNIGMCARECMVGHLANGPGGTQTPIDLAECRAACPEFVEAERAVGDLCAFMRTPGPPLLRSAPGGAAFVDHAAVPRGRRVFERACASCHSNGQPLPRDVLSDDEIHPAAAVGTNSCRARTSNWQAGHIWAAFSSDQYKARPTGGPGYYRNVPLQAIWATAPFLHNNRLGNYTGDISVAGRIAAYEDAMDQLLNPWRRDLLGSVQRTTAPIALPTPLGPVTLPAGTPVAAFANLDPKNPLHNLCPDLIENAGHYYGALLPAADKYALKEFLKTR